MFKSLSKYKKVNIQLSEYYNKIFHFEEKEVEVLNSFPPEYQYISDKYYNKKQPIINKFQEIYLDINTLENNNLNILESNSEIKIIKIFNKFTNKIKLFLLTDREIKTEYLNEELFELSIFKNEKDLLLNFITYFKNVSPIIVNSWFGNSIVFPYLIKRLKYYNFKISKLSPFNKTLIKKIKINGEDFDLELPFGIYFLDYTYTYDFFKKKKSESYILEDIYNLELNKNIKKNNNLKYLYFEKIYSFIEYEKEHIKMLKELDKFLNYNNILIKQSWDMGVNFSDVFSTVKPWTYKMFNELKKEKIVLPSIEKNIKKEYKGGHIKVAKQGKYKYVTSIDIKAGYPNILRTNNISYETLLEDYELTNELIELRNIVRNNGMEDYLISLDNKELNKIKKILEKHNCIMSPSGHFFSKTISGVLPNIVEKIFNEREEAKSKYLKLQEISKKANEILEKKKKINF